MNHAGLVFGLLTLSAAPAIANAQLVSGEAPAVRSIPPVPSGPVEFSVGDEGQSFSSASARGRFLAIHFLLNADSPANAALVREYTLHAPELAGTTHIFIRAGSAEEFRSMLAGLPPTAAKQSFRDVDSKLAARLNVPGGFEFHGRTINHPALILLDASGNEIFRQVFDADANRLHFTQFAAKLADLSTDKQTAEGNTSGSLALEGYDPVAYIDQHKAIPGDSALQSAFHGVTYRFASAAHRDAFNADPAKYLPAYGGWCATAMAKGEKVEVDPSNFKITGGRLFLFYKGLWGNAQKDWNKDEPALILEADQHWKAITAGK